MNKKPATSATEATSKTPQAKSNPITTNHESCLYKLLKDASVKRKPPTTKTSTPEQKSTLPLKSGPSKQTKYWDWKNEKFHDTTKRIQALILLIESGTKGANFEEAENKYGERNFASSISKLKDKFNLQILKIKLTIHLNDETTTKDTRYRLANTFEARKALKLIQEESEELSERFSTNELLHPFEHELLDSMSGHQK